MYPKKLRQAYNVLWRTVQDNPDHLTALLHYANFCRVLVNEREEDVEALYERIECGRPGAGTGMCR